MLVRFTYIRNLDKVTSDISIHWYDFEFRLMGLLCARAFLTLHIVFFYLLALFRILPCAYHIFTVVTLLVHSTVVSLTYTLEMKNFASDWSISAWTARTLVSWRHLAADEADGARLPQPMSGMCAVANKSLFAPCGNYQGNRVLFAKWLLQSR